MNATLLEKSFEITDFLNQELEKFITHSYFEKYPNPSGALESQEHYGKKIKEQVFSFVEQIKKEAIEGLEIYKSQHNPILNQLIKKMDSVKLTKKNLENKSVLELLKPEANEIIELFNIAEDFVQKKDYERASKMFSFIIFLIPSDFTGWYGKGVCSEFAGHNDEAREFYQASIQFGPTSPIPWLAASRCSLKKNDTENARIYIEKAIEFAKKDEAGFSNVLKAAHKLEKEIIAKNKKLKS